MDLKTATESMTDPNWRALGDVLICLDKEIEGEYLNNKAARVNEKLEDPDVYALVQRMLFWVPRKPSFDYTRTFDGRLGELLCAVRKHHKIT